MKLIAFLIVTALSLLIGLLPELVMYFLWTVVNPTDQFVKVIMIALFLLGGGSLSIFFGVLGFAMWVALATAILESK